MGLSTVEAWKHIVPNGDMVELDDGGLHALQAVLLGMLRDLVSVCGEEGIDITMSGGTCLGAVRHKGFIPWDDDVDINVARRDLDRLIASMAERFPGKYCFQGVGVSEGYELGCPRIRLVGTAVKSREDLSGGQCGACVDLFVLEDVPDGAIRRKAHGLVSLALGLACSCARFFEHREEYLAFASATPEVAPTFGKKIRLGRLFSFRRAADWCRSWDRWNSRFRNPDSKYISIPVGRKHYFGELYRREDFFPASYGEFEGMRVPLPANPDAYLAALYGPDYMTPPPEADRERHVVLEFDLGDYDPRRREKESAE